MSYSILHSNKQHNNMINVDLHGFVLLRFNQLVQISIKFYLIKLNNNLHFFLTLTYCIQIRVLYLIFFFLRLL